MQMISNYANYQNFGAQYIAPAKVKKHSSRRNRYHDQKVSFVELEADNPNDAAALDYINRKWASAKYVSRIKRDFDVKSEGILRNPHLYKTYALTTQKNNFDKLRPWTILGITEVKDYSDDLCIELLEVNPRYKNSNQKRKYKYVGTAILDTLKNLYSKEKDIVLNSADEAKVFYEKNDFVEECQNPRIFVYPRQDSKS